MFVNVAKNSLNQCHCCSMLYTKVIIKDEKNYLTLSFNEINIRLESKNKYLTALLNLIYVLLVLVIWLQHTIWLRGLP